MFKYEVHWKTAVFAGAGCSLATIAIAGFFFMSANESIRENANLHKSRAISLQSEVDELKEVGEENRALSIDLVEIQTELVHVTSDKDSLLNWVEAEKEAAWESKYELEHVELIKSEETSALLRARIDEERDAASKRVQGKDEEILSLTKRVGELTMVTESAQINDEVEMYRSLIDEKTALEHQIHELENAREEMEDIHAREVGELEGELALSLQKADEIRGLYLESQGKASWSDTPGYTSEVAKDSLDSLIAAVAKMKSDPSRVRIIVSTVPQLGVKVGGPDLIRLLESFTYKRTGFYPLEAIRGIEEHIAYPLKKDEIDSILSRVPGEFATYREEVAKIIMRQK